LQLSFPRLDLQSWQNRGNVVANTATQLKCGTAKGGLTDIYPVKDSLPALLTGGGSRRGARQ